ncbi:MAG TPA: ABC transporter substrate-binding protein [Terriglobales bacterium]|nr:ABC transporter substrate-binding protein [Terriglobales bacterium]
MRRVFFGTCLFLVAFLAAASCSDELRFYLRSEPKTFNPALVADDSSETVRYLTGGVLLRLNRQSQNLQPELAQAWTVSRDGRTITFTLRKNVRFSDGTPFSALDVKYTMEQLMDPALHSPTGDAFRSSSGRMIVTVLGPDKVAITFPAPVAGLAALFDQVAIVSSQSARHEMASLGPFYIAEHKPGSYVYLRRNPNYWKHDVSGRQLPYLDSIKLEIQSNRDIEFLRFTRNEIHLINSMDADYFDRLALSAPAKVRDAGPSLDSEQMWFNQVPTAPIPAYKREWFRSRSFRLAISSGISRDDLCKVVFKGHATPARGPVSPANKFWFNARLQPVPLDTKRALQLLEQDGFRLSSGKLYDRAGHPVEFSIVTNAGNRAREAMATMIQQDLRAAGITVNVVTLDFPSLIQRISKSFDYEAALLGLVNDELDPNAQMNVWLSSSEEHQWNPQQSAPATPWEAEIDQLMRAQASSMQDATRKKYYDRVQKIVADEAPFIYLVNKNALTGITPTVQGARPVPLRPQTFWNIEYLKLADERAGSGN